MKTHDQYRKAIGALLAILTALFPVTPAMADWPDDARNCVGGTTKDYPNMKTGSYRFADNCLSKQSYALPTGDGDAVVIARLHRAQYFDKKARKKVYRQLGLKAPKLKKYKRDLTQFTGLRTDNGEILVPTIYEEVAPFSATHSLVKTLDGRIKIAEHRTGKLIDLPKERPEALWGSVLDPQSGHLSTGVWLGTREGTTGTFARLLPGLSLGEAIENVNVQKRSLDTLKSAFIIHLVDPITGIESAQIFGADLRPTVVAGAIDSFKRFATAHEMGSKYQNSNPTRGIGAYGGGIKSYYMPMIRVGELDPAIGLKSKYYYWPMDPSGNPLPRINGVSGLLPLTRSYALIVLDAEQGHDYIVGYSVKSNDPTFALSELEDWLILDDIRILRGGQRFAFRSFETPFAGRHWRNLSSPLKKTADLRFTPFASSPELAVTEYENKRTQYAAKLKEAAKQRKIRADLDRRNAALAKLSALGGRPSSDCSLSRGAASLGSNLTKQIFIEAWGYDAAAACQMVPQEILNDHDRYRAHLLAEKNRVDRGPGFDWSTVLRELGNRAAAAPKYYKCTPNRDGRTKTCGWSKTP